jgi:hypothetical protein
MTATRSQPPWSLPDELLDAGITVPRNIIEAIDHPRWWGEWFKTGNWTAWKVALRAMFALPLEGEEELAVFQKHTGRVAPPTVRPREMWAICGRRSGKTRMMATVACWAASFVDWRNFLAAGRSERATIMLLAADRRQARTAMRYIRSLIREHGLLRQLIERESAEEIVLTCGTSIEVVTAGFRGTRGYTVAAVLADEVSFWRDEDSSNPATEIFTALRPAMATLPGSLLMVATTPYSPRGITFETWKRHWAKDDDPILVWRAATREMNESVPQEVVDEAMALDPASAAAEFMGEFRRDVEVFITAEILEMCIVPRRHELPPVAGITYSAFVDPSGGSADAMTLAVAHRDRAGCVVLDAVREVRPPFSPQDVVWEFAKLLKTYGVGRVVGDRYAGEWPREQFRKAGIEYQPSELSKSQLYGELLPLLNGHRAELLDHPRLIAQLLGLERRTARGGRDSIDHGPHAHDDVANAVAGALVNCAASGTFRPTPEFVASFVKRARAYKLAQERRAAMRF